MLEANSVTPDKAAKPIYLKGVGGGEHGIAREPYEREILALGKRYYRRQRCLMSNLAAEVQFLTPTW